MNRRAKKKHKILRIVVITIILFFGFIILYDDSAKRLPSVPEDLRNHTLLTSRMRGSCETLTGDILLTVIFVEEPEGTWTATDLESTKKEIEEAVSILTKEAASYGARLDITLNYMQSSSGESLTVNEYEIWTNNVLINASLPNIHKVNKSLESSYDVKEAPVVFCINKIGRSFTYRKDNYTSQEYSVLYKGDRNSFRHEISHIFGSKDYYLDVMKEIAVKYFPNSIMISDSDESVSDSLTAYLVGWTDVLSEEALSFLRETANITQEDYSGELEKETYTGYDTRKTSAGIYTGEFVLGAYHGTGKMVWNDGTVYEGDWKSNLQNGQGTITYANGDVYVGEWENGLPHGKGTYTFANGTICTSEWINGMMQGQGTLTYPNGDIVTGTWKDNEFVN